MPSDQVMRALHRAAEADDRGALWAALGPLREELTRERMVAVLWAEALRTTPGRPGLIEESKAILDAYSEDAPIVLSVGDALLRRAERRPADEPPEPDGPASLAAAAASRCRGRLSAADTADPEIGGRLSALHGNALSLLGEKRTQDAVDALEAAIALDDERARWHSDLARVHKRARGFESSLRSARRAVELDPTDRGARWNLAIAATARGEAEVAARCWTALGMQCQVREAAFPFVDGLEPLRVRLPTLGTGTTIAPVPDEAASFEVVWVQPLSPCHGVVRTPTMRAATADFGDTILFDGSPVTVSQVDGRTVPTMALLGVLVRGDERRFPFLALQQRAEQVSALARSIEPVARLIPVGERVEVMCPRCAAGELLTRHEHLPEETHRVAFGKLIVEGGRDLSEVAQAIAEARREHSGVLLAIPELHEALGDTKTAGKHHKRWGEIERTRSRGSG